MRVDHPVCPATGPISASDLHITLKKTKTRSALETLPRHLGRDRRPGTRMVRVRLGVGRSDLAVLAQLTVARSTNAYV
jgi:hypothetical protein